MEKELLACIDDKNVKYLQSGQISKYVFPMERKEAHLKKVTHLIIRFFIVSINTDNKNLNLISSISKIRNPQSMKFMCLFGEKNSFQSLISKPVFQYYRHNCHMTT